MKNKMHGHGLKRWPDGTSYKGEFVEGLYEGYGCLSYWDGRKFEGGFIGGKKDGPIKRTTSQGKVYYELYRDDESKKDIKETDFL